MQKLVMAIDQGTTSTRSMPFNRSGEVLGLKQMEHVQFFPKRGCGKHKSHEDRSTVQIFERDILRENGLSSENPLVMDITNQCKIPLVWKHEKGNPYILAIFCQDVEAISRNWQENSRCQQNMDKEPQQKFFTGWGKTITRPYDWVKGGG